MTMRPLFTAFAPPIRQQTALREAITSAYRRPERDCVHALLGAASLPYELRSRVKTTASALVVAMRSRTRSFGTQALVQEYGLSSDEGVALMCLAEALLRIPDAATRDALIRDKIGNGDWQAHAGFDRSLFVNAATWALVVTGKLVDGADEKGLKAALTSLIGRVGEPVIRRGVEMMMSLMGEQFVSGETIEKALVRSRSMDGFLYSYDMLGEAATTADDARRYATEYRSAIHAIGEHSTGDSVYEKAGISVKLSALHPRYERAQADRVMVELLPRLKAIAKLARFYGIGLNIDAEEADRLELSLDLLESLAFDPELAGWDGLGFVVQAYGKRCPYVIDWLIDLARRSDRRLMVRLVKGAYWDSEIKRTQVDGLADFPVYTRKIHTDIAYIACARKLLAARAEIFPQFATHNAQTLATIYHLAGTDFSLGDYEFQCLYGMGEPLYEHVVGEPKLQRPCRIYAPVGTHRTLLPYLVRRLLENGANSSFVNLITDPAVPIEELVADPIDIVCGLGEIGTPHEKIDLPAKLYPDRLNSSGIDLSNEFELEALSEALFDNGSRRWCAAPTLGSGSMRTVLNPADQRDIVGTVVELSPSDSEELMARALSSRWGQTPVAERAAMLERAADNMQAEMPSLLGLLVREAGKSPPNAVSEVREAVDFLRYYAAHARATLGPAQQPLGVVVCISPWNFPLAIFTGQVSAALAAGNAVLAKPASATPLIAAEAIRLLHEAGIPRDALQLTPGSGALGSALIASAGIAGVIFTGSTDVARLIQGHLAKRLSPAGHAIPLIAETGGQNAMIVDSSALSEQVVAAVLASAFDSAGQRCSALRILCLQDDIADRILTMLKGALRELRIGRTDALSVDVGPVINAASQEEIENHIAHMRSRGAVIDRHSLPLETEHGTFVAPTIIEIDSISELEREVFGPVLHVIRFLRDELGSVIDAINGTGYGLTFGLHSRLESTIAEVTARVNAGNIYVNRNTIGAIVGVQPFGGTGLSGTGPKAGGPLYLNRLVTGTPMTCVSTRVAPAPLRDFAEWLENKGEAECAEIARRYAAASALNLRLNLPGPVGEQNFYSLHSRGRVLMKSITRKGLFEQMAAVLATGNSGVVRQPLPLDLPASVTDAFAEHSDGPLTAALVEDETSLVAETIAEVASMSGPIVSVHTAQRNRELAYDCNWLLKEVCTSIDTTAAGGNANLMMIG